MIEEPMPTMDHVEAGGRVRERLTEHRRAWAGRLGRLRLGVEPLEEQLDRLRRVTWAITGVIGGLAVLFLALFTAFRRPDLGALLVLILLGPMLTLAWLDLKSLERKAAAYRDGERRILETNDISPSDR